ncbi:TB2/DP1, HVA22 family-domain-containing protein [Russula compacta]|nr:TB2/DP1, HVA22 family-domain-containing protein [Russula compacta]
MLMFLLSRLLTGWFTFLLPSYSTFKALRQRPLNEREIEKWFGYWIVIGAVVAFEYTAEWLLSWFPFYWEIKTLLLLFLSLPQFEGSTYIYKTYVEPYLVQNEPEIDASIASARDETLQFLQLRLSALWDIFYSLLNKTPVPSRGDSTNGSPLVDQKAFFQSVQDLWGTISPVSFLAASAPGSGEPTASTSASDTFGSAKQAPTLSPLPLPLPP